MDDFEDDLAMEEWLEMSDEQQEAMLDRKIKAWQRWRASLPISKRVALSRKTGLESILTWKRLRREHGWDFAVEHIRQSQRYLLKLRIWRATGIYPGSA